MDKLKLWFRKFSEAWTACMMCMVQGDLSVLNIKHAITASKTGTLAGLAFVVASFFPWDIKWLGVWLTGVFTMMADIIVHPTHFGGTWTEAITTGAVAACIAFVFEKFIIEKKGEYK